MNVQSSHLQDVLDIQEGVTHVLIVFADIEKYSRRTSSRQKKVIDTFSDCLDKALTETANEFVEYAQKKNVNFETDIIKLPIGDGAAVVFPFGAPHTFHLFFAKALLKIVNEMNARSACDKFVAEGWCNCHSNFNLRIGISAGDGIIYEDINKRFNIAGGVINLASRVVNAARPNEILFSEDAYKSILEFSQDKVDINHFGKGLDITIKHDMVIKVYDYKGIEVKTDKPSDKIIFRDDFEIPGGWANYGAGSVIHSSEYVHSGNLSLKKDANTDPHGGLKILDGPIPLGFIFSGWMYRPSDGGLNLDRLGIENDENNGYGFYVDHRKVEFRIERRDKGRASYIVDPQKINVHKMTDAWYQFIFGVKTDGTLELCLKDTSGKEIAVMSTRDTRYGTFDRIVVHGGYRYYVDDIQIELCP